MKNYKYSIIVDRVYNFKYRISGNFLPRPKNFRKIYETLNSKYAQSLKEISKEHSKQNIKILYNNILRKIVNYFFDERFSSRMTIKELFDIFFEENHIRFELHM